MKKGHLHALRSTYHFVGKEQYYPCVYNSSFASPSAVYSHGTGLQARVTAHMYNCLYSGLLSEMLCRSILTIICLPLSSTFQGQKLHGKEPGKAEGRVTVALPDLVQTHAMGNHME